MPSNTAEVTPAPEGEAPAAAPAVSGADLHVPAAPSPPVELATATDTAVDAAAASAGSHTTVGAVRRKGPRKPVVAPAAAVRGSKGSSGKAGGKGATKQSIRRTATKALHIDAGRLSRFAWSLLVVQFFVALGGPSLRGFYYSCTRSTVSALSESPGMLTLFPSPPPHPRPRLDWDCKHQHHLCV